MQMSLSNLITAVGVVFSKKEEHMRHQPLARETSERFSVRRVVVAGWLGRTCYASNRQDVIESELPH